MSHARPIVGYMHSTDERLLTKAVIRAITADDVILGEYVFAAVGPADARTKTNEEAAIRLRQLTEDCGATVVFRRRAPMLAALVVLGRLDDVDWTAVEEAIAKAVRPARRRQQRKSARRQAR